MGFYERSVVPWLTHMSMRQRTLVPYRQRVVSAASGRVLEIGIGSGLNLPFYAGAADGVIGLDPSPRLLDRARAATAGGGLPVTLVEGSAEAIPLDDASVDTVLTTWTMCSIPDAHRALGEMRRVLRPGGRLLFVEHGLAPDDGVRAWQDRLTPLWRRLSGGCRLNRPMRRLVEDAGFAVERMETGYMKGPKPMAFMYEGSAAPR